MTLHTDAEAVRIRVDYLKAMGVAATAVDFGNPIEWECGCSRRHQGVIFSFSFTPCDRHARLLAAMPPTAGGEA